MSGECLLILVTIWLTSGTTTAIEKQRIPMERPTCVTMETTLNGFTAHGKSSREIVATCVCFEE